MCVLRRILIFCYGSLMNKASLALSVGQSDDHTAPMTPRMWLLAA